MFRRSAVMLALFVSSLPAQSPSFDAASVNPDSSGADGGIMGFRY